MVAKSKALCEEEMSNTNTAFSSSLMLVVFCCCSLRAMTQSRCEKELPLFYLKGNHLLM